MKTSTWLALILLPSLLVILASHPLPCLASCEACTNSVDDDGDGFVDCDDEDCWWTAPCDETSCSNGLDDDSDGFTDCEDEFCWFAPECTERCSSGVDDDSDGFTDCDDEDCWSAPECNEICDNLVDDDSDGFADCEDEFCWSAEECRETCDDLVDDDSDGFTDCDDEDCWSAPECLEGCDDGGDDDGDGFTDCDDEDCWLSAACVRIELTKTERLELAVLPIGGPKDSAWNLYRGTLFDAAGSMAQREAGLAGAAHDHAAFGQCGLGGETIVFADDAGSHYFLLVSTCLGAEGPLGRDSLRRARPAASPPCP